MLSTFGVFVLSKVQILDKQKERQIPIYASSLYKKLLRV